MEKAARDILVISDLHIGDGGPRDNFEAGGRALQLRGFLDYVGSEGAELFVLGDLFELWQMSMSLIFMRRRALLDQLAALPLIYVPGNHDIDLIHFAGTDFLAHPFFDRMKLPFIRELGGKRFRFAHGHETDPFNAGDSPGFGRMLSIFAGIFEDQNGSPVLASGEGVEEVLEQFGESMLTLWIYAMSAILGSDAKAPEEGAPRTALTPAQNPNRLAEHVLGVRSDLEKRGDDVAVVGHTHRPGRISAWYFNSGSWVGQANWFLRISSDGQVRQLEWKDGRPIEREIEVLIPDVKPSSNPFQAARSSLTTLFPKPQKPERSRWVTLAQGSLALAVGGGALSVSLGEGWATGMSQLLTAFGVYVLVDGALSLIGAMQQTPIKRLFYRVRGVLSLLLGLVVLRRGYFIEAFVVLVGLWALVSGTLRVAIAMVLRKAMDSRWLLVVGSISTIAGLILLLWPTSVVLLKFGLSGTLCLYGAGEILSGIFGQPRRR